MRDSLEREKEMLMHFDNLLLSVQASMSMAWPQSELVMWAESERLTTAIANCPPASNCCCPEVRSGDPILAWTVNYALPLNETIRQTPMDWGFGARILASEQLWPPVAAGLLAGG